PIASRLFFVAFFAESSRVYLRRDAEAFDVLGLQQRGSALKVRANLEALHRQLPLLEGSDRFAFSVMHELLRVGATLTQLQGLAGGALCGGRPRRGGGGRDGGARPGLPGPAAAPRRARGAPRRPRRALRRP